MRHPAKILIVTGSRNLLSRKIVWRFLDRWDPDIVIHGAHHSGADAFAAEWCEKNGVRDIPVRAPWILGRQAGPIRNKEMVAIGAVFQRLGNRVLCVGWPKGQSRGTRGCMHLAKRAGIKTINRMKSKSKRSA